MPVISARRILIRTETITQRLSPAGCTIDRLVAVAVLIVNFRTYAELDRCLATCTASLTADDEVVVVDHASDPHALTRALERYPRVVSIPRAANPGFSAGVNDAARHSQAPYLLLLNPDALVPGTAIRALEQWLTAHPRVGVVGPRLVNPDGAVEASARGFPDITTTLGGRSTWLSRRFPNNRLSRRNLLGREAVDALAVDWVAGACLMTPRAVFDRVGGFDEGFFLYWEDADYCRRVGRLNLECVYLPTVTAEHIGGAGAQFAQRRSIRAHHASAFRFYWKHATPAARLAGPLVGAGLAARARGGLWRGRGPRPRPRRPRPRRLPA